jgi:membrane associated rhomboid family serine protease
VNYTLLAANIVVFLYMLSLATGLSGTRRSLDQRFVEQTNGICYGYRTLPNDSDAFVCRWAFQPKEFFDIVQDKSVIPHPDRTVILLTILTALFLHAGWLHILGNMVFLWVFGDNVEDRLGHIPYLLFYLVAGVVATLTQGFIDPGSAVPILGASGAIAGVLGAYLVFFPGARITAVIPFIIPIPLWIPAFLMIGLWFAQNLLAGFATINNAASPDDTVAFFAHIGGFVFGMIVAFIIRRSTPAYRPRRNLPLG